MPSPRNSRPLVLIVDDDADTREILSLCLTPENMSIISAEDAPTALAVMREQRPDAVLLDLGLPGMDGLELCRRIRGDPALGHTVVVALTGHARSQDQRSALAAGCDAVLTKPCELARMVAELRRWFPRVGV